MRFQIRSCIYVLSGESAKSCGEVARLTATNTAWLTTPRRSRPILPSTKIFRQFPAGAGPRGLLGSALCSILVGPSPLPAVCAARILA